MNSDTAFLQPGVTTKDETVARLGSPTIIWRDENVLIYRWVKRRGTLFWVVGGGYTGAAGATDIPQEVAFLLRFDADDRYVESETLKRPAFKSFGDFLLEWRDAQRAREEAPAEGAS